MQDEMKCDLINKYILSNPDVELVKMAKQAIAGQLK